MTKVKQNIEKNPDKPGKCTPYVRNELWYNCIKTQHSYTHSSGDILYRQLLSGVEM